MKMKTAIFFSIMVCTPLAASAQEASSSFSWGDVTFQPRVYAGYADYTLQSGDFDVTTIYYDGRPPKSEKQRLNFDLAGHNKIQIKGPLFGIGGTVASGRFFGDFYYQSTLDDTAYSSFEEIVDAFTIHEGDVDAQHYDWALSIGYLITDQWSVFVGYKAGNTEWDQAYNFNPRPPFDTTKLALTGKIDGEFEQDGPFLGTSYSFPVGPGVLSVKAAYAYLDGTYKRSAYGVIYPPFSGTPEELDVYSYGKLNGNSDAYSFGISWSQPISHNLGYSVGANYHRYEFDMSGTLQTKQQNVPFEQRASGGSLTEELFTVTASLLYTF
ncbi:MAG: hypothetical protein JNJ76_00460 [Candidatus Competibacter sp.]|nr:hypothetical protein [Candidatus Competibacter sp.]